jgi:hypothetical protein
MAAIWKKVINPLKLHEFFLCDVTKVLKEQLPPAINGLDKQLLE